MNINWHIAHAQAAADAAIEHAGLGPITSDHVMMMCAKLARRGLMANDSDFRAIVGHATSMIIERTAQAT